MSERPHGAERSSPPQRRKGGVWREQLRPTAQTTFSAGRPLEEPEPQGSHAGAAGGVVDSSSLRFLTAAALRQREEEEQNKEVDEAAACSPDTGADAQIR